jgi:hypothetical protein
MATTPTNKPIPSEDPRDLKFNAGKIDEEVNGSADYYTDRFSVQRLTNTGRNNQFQIQMSQQADDWLAQFNQQESEFQQFLLNSGYQFLGDYENGPYTITARNQIIRYQNEFWRLNASTNPPYTTTGVNSTSWAVDVTHMVSVGDATLRQDMASTEVGKGTDLLGYKRKTLNSLISTASGMFDAQPIYCYEFVDVITDKPNVNDPTTWDWTPAINAAIAASKADRFQPVVLPPHKVITTGGHLLTSQVMETAGGSPTDGKNYKGVPLVGYGKNISKLMFKPSTSTSVCISLVGNGGGHDTTSYLRGFTIDAYDSTYRLNGYGIELNGVNYCFVYDVTIYYLNENFRFYNGISGCWTEFNNLVNCMSYRGNVCYSFVRGAGNDSFNGTSFTKCFGQIKKSGGGYGLKLTGNSSSSLVWLYGATLGLTFYGGDLISDGCKVISLNYAEMTLNDGDIHCEGAVIMEALDDYSRCQHRGRWLNNGTTTFSLVSERVGAQGRFTFQNLHSRQSAFSDSNISAYTPGVMPVTPDIYNNNGTTLLYMSGTNFASPMLTCQEYAGNGFYFGQIPQNGSINDIVPSWKVSNDAGIFKTYNPSGLRFQINDLETFRFSSTAIYPTTNNGLQSGTTGNRWAAAYYKQFSINDTGLVPTATATYNIGASGAAVNNIYSQNAVTVVSDARHKTDIRDLTSQEISCARLCAKNIKLYKLNAAVAEKGDLARYHVGVIAQDIISAFDSCGLDWKLYGIVTYESWGNTPAVAAEYDANGDLLVEGIAEREAGDIYMVRYEELNAFIMAAMAQDLGW